MQLRRCAVALVLAFGLLLEAPAARADVVQPGMGVFIQPNAQVDLGLEFVDAGGIRGTLKDFVPKNRPFILVPIFYKCPRLCGLTFSGLIELVDNLPLILGTDYGIVAFSFNPAEGPNEAAEKRDSVLKRLKAQPVPLNGWRFLTGDGKAIAALNSQLGFRVRMADQEFEHSSAIFVAGPNGTVARHFTGVEFDPRKVAAAIKDAR